MYVKGSDDDKSPLNDESREVHSSKLNPLRFHVNDGIDDEDGRKGRTITKTFGRC